MSAFFELRAEDVEPIVKSHMTTWGATDLSVQLGETFLRHFYTLAIEDPDTLALGVRGSKDNNLAGWCIGFRRYHEFNAALKKRMGLSLPLLTLKKLVFGPLRIKKVVNHFFAKKPEKIVLTPNCHLGAFGRVGSAFETVILLSNLIGHMASELCRNSTSCWAVTNDDNKGARMVMERAGFAFKDTVSEGDQINAVYEYVN